MNAITLRPSAIPDRASENISPVREEPRLVESAYRIVTALRADPLLVAEALPPDAYLAALDSVVLPHATDHHSDEFSRRIETRGHEEPQS